MPLKLVARLEALARKSRRTCAFDARRCMPCMVRACAHVRHCLKRPEASGIGLVRGEGLRPVSLRPRTEDGDALRCGLRLHVALGHWMRGACLDGLHAPSAAHWIELVLAR